MAQRYGKELMSTIFHGRAFRESRLRDSMGPSNPLYHLLRAQTVDMYTFMDDFDQEALNGDYWTLHKTSSADWANLASQPGGVCQVISDATQNEYAGIYQGGSGLVYAANRRPVMLCRFAMGAAMTFSKWEVGFSDGDADAGAVNSATTPTSTATDYAVLIRDTDSAVTVKGITDGTTDAVEAVTLSPGVTFAVSTEYNLMIGIDENSVCRFWIDNVYQGASARGPDAATALGIWIFAQSRSATPAARTFRVDYVKAWQERLTQA